MQVQAEKKHIAPLRRISIKKRLRLILLVIAVLLIVAFGTMISMMVSSYVSFAGLSNTRLLGLMQDPIVTGIDTLIAATKYPVQWNNSLPNNTYQYLSKPDRFSRTILYSDLSYQSTFIFQQRRQVRLVAIFDMNGKGYYSKNEKKSLYYIVPYHESIENTDALSSVWYQQTMEADGSYKIWRPQEMSLPQLVLANKEDMLFVSRAIVSIEKMKPIGIILTAVDISEADRVFEENKLMESQRRGFFNQNGKLLWGDMSDGKISEFLNYTYTHKNLGNDGSFKVSKGSSVTMYHYNKVFQDYYIVLETPYHELIGGVIEKRALMLTGLLFICILITIAMNYVVKSISAPIKSLVNSCNDVKSGNFSVVVEDYSNDEFAELSTAFNAMTREIEHLIYEVYDKKMEVSRTELQLLRSQINPHLLYNTLDTIRNKALLDGHEDLGDMALLLAKILRYGITPTTGPVTVATEIDMLREYLRLQKFMYAERLSDEINIEPEILDCKMIKFLLQPLVENAIYHGIFSIDSGGSIVVLGFVSGEDIIFKVIDNGQGIDRETVEKLTDYIDNRNDAFKSIGLKNVHRRVKLTYGPEYGISIQSEPGRGTMISLKIPYRK